MYQVKVDKALEFSALLVEALSGVCIGAFIFIPVSSMPVSIQESVGWLLQHCLCLTFLASLVVLPSHREIDWGSG